MPDKFTAIPPKSRGWVAPVVPWAALADVALAALAGAIIAGRAAYLAPLWAAYGVEPAALLRFIEGGLGWHGVLLGALAGGWLAWRWRARAHVRFGSLLDAAAPLAAVAAALMWAGCAGGACAWGREVATLADHPAWLVTWARDAYGIAAPRFATHFFGAAAALAMLLLALPWAGRGRFWLAVLAGASAMFVIGFVRADPVPTLFGLRADQAADAVTAAWAAALFALARRASHHPDPV